MKVLLITLFVTTVGLTICQAQTQPDTGRIRTYPQPVTIHLDDKHTFSHKPLIIVKGKEVTDVNQINPDSIKSLDVIGPTDPRRKTYGRKGRYGIVLIELKSDSSSRR